MTASVVVERRHLLVDALLRGCGTWADFVAQVALLDSRAKGHAFERLIQLYLALDPQYATTLRKVWLYDEVPAPVRRLLRLPSRDKGIDLVAETKHGGYWAIQAKYRTERERALTFRELSTFGALAYVTCQGIEYALVCTTADRIARELEGIPRRVGSRTSEVWEALGNEFFARVGAALNQRVPRLTAARPRPHQRRAIKNAFKHYRDERKKRGKLIHPCGTGKTLTAYWIAEKLGARTILVAVPSLALIRQTLEVWLRESVAAGRQVDWLCVCSDESAGSVDRDELTAHTHELGVPCVTDPKVIADWLRAYSRGTRVVFATYQSGKALAAGARRAGRSFDLGIMDEAHKTVGAKAKTFAHLLHDRNVPIRRRLFMTATERHYKGSSDQILSMDDEAVYGETVDLLTFKKAIATKPPILADYEVLVLGVGLKPIRELIRRNAFVRPDRGGWRELEAETLAAVVALRKAMKRHTIRHAVSFHSSIRRAQEFTNHQDAFTRALRPYGNLSTFHVSAKLRTSERSRELQAFGASRRGLVTNARCLTEGVDLPDIDGVLFADPKRSAIDIVQATGRALRLAKGKRRGYVVVPLLIDEAQSREEIIDSSEFRQVLAILRALASNDQRIVEQFRSISSKRRPTARVVRIDVHEIEALALDLKQFSREIELRAWNKLARLAWQPFTDAREFARGLGLGSSNEWSHWYRLGLPDRPERPRDIPTNPDKIYAESGWASWGDWLGTGRVYARDWRPFPQARQFARDLGLRSNDEWARWCRGEIQRKRHRPLDIPATPDHIYANRGWAGWGDWLGTGNIRRGSWRRFSSARSYARLLKLRSETEWRDWFRGALKGKPKRPLDIPYKPDRAYGSHGWAGWGDWLGNTSRARPGREFRDFAEARDFARSLGLKNPTEWTRWCTGRIEGKPPRPADIPTNPNRVYADRGWAGMSDWLGTRRAKGWRPFPEARRFAQGLRIRNQIEWGKWVSGRLRGRPRRPSDIPVHPERAYAGAGWAGMGDWLGTGRIHRGNWRPFSNARSFARSLRLRNGMEWKRWCKGELPGKPKRPSDIPITPHQVYGTRGWAGFGDWLGTGSIAPSRREWWPFRRARTFARGLRLRGKDEWVLWSKGAMKGKQKRPAGVPSNPQQVYADDGWAGFPDWLGTMGR